VALLGSFGTSASWRGGIYENEYVLDNGVWKISRVQFFEQYRGAYDEYGHKAPATWGVPYHFDSMHVGVTIPKSALDASWPASKLAPAARLAGLAQRVQRLQDENRRAEPAAQLRLLHGSASCGTTWRICSPTTARGKWDARASTWAGPTSAARSRATTARPRCATASSSITS
jgi:hypothetical protein